jgi:WD40 repeat protein
MPEEEKDIELWDLSKPEYIPSHPLKDGLKKILIWKDKNGEPRIIYLSENKEMFQLLLTELVNQTGEVSEKGIPYNKDIDSIFIDDGDILTISHTQENTKTFVGKFDHELKPLEEKIVNKEVASIIRTDDGVYILVDNNNDAYVYKDYSSLSQNSGKMINDNESGIGKISVIRPIPKTPPLLVIGKEEKFCPYDYSKKELVPCDINFDDDEVKKIDLAEFTENGKFLITTDKKKSLNIWNVVNVKSDQGIPIVKFNKKLTLGEKVSLFAIKPGQEPDYLLATLLKIEDTIYIYIWDFQGRQLAQFTTDFDQAENLMFSPDGNILIATGDTKIGDKKIQVWDLKKLKLSKLLSEGCLRLETYLETDKPLKKDCKPHLEKAKKNLSLSLKAY